MEIPQVATEAELGGGGLTGQLILILVLTLINAFFSAAEMAMVSVDQNKLKSDADEGVRNQEKSLQYCKINQTFFLLFK